MIARPINEFGDVVYDVYLGTERLAWGLTDQAAADRWVARLAAGGRAGQPGDEDDGVLAGTTPFTPRRVWWNE